MTKPDQADREAAEDLPCGTESSGMCSDGDKWIRSGLHLDGCPAKYRPVVAARLRARDAEIAELGSQLRALQNAHAECSFTGALVLQAQTWMKIKDMELAELRAEVTLYKELYAEEKERH